MPSPIELDGPYYPPIRQRLLRAAYWLALWATLTALAICAAALVVLGTTA